MKLKILLVLCAVLGRLRAHYDEQKCDKTHPKKIFCYYQSTAATTNSSFHRNFHSWPFPPCTHIVFAFAGIDIDGNVILSHNQQVGARVEQEIYDLMRLKEKHECLKVLLAVGGYDEGSEKFSSLVETAESIEKFSEKVLKFLIFYGFDGIDIHWMYPTMRGGIPDDRQNFVRLLHALKQKLTRRSKLVVAALGGSSKLISSAYGSLKEVCDALDYAILMTYDYGERQKTSINAPLLHDAELRYGETVEENIERVLREKCESKKIILGISTYGRVYKLKLAMRNHIGAPAVEMSDIDGNSLETGTVRYAELCNSILKNSPLASSHLQSTINWTVKKMSKSQSKYAYREKIWVTFDDHETVEVKTLYALSKSLSGVMFFTLNGDGDCKLHYPLIHSSKGMIDEFNEHCQDSDAKTCVRKIAQNHSFESSFIE